MSRGKKIERPIVRCNINLFEDSAEILRSHFPHRGLGEIVRHLVDNFTRRLEAKTKSKLAPGAEEESGKPSPFEFDRSFEP